MSMQDIALKTLPNMCVAHVAIELGLNGPTMALCDDADMGPLALQEAALAVARGDAPWALAGGADARLAFGDRLSAGGRIDDTQSRMPQRRSAIGRDPGMLFVRAAMGERGSPGGQTLGRYGATL